MKPTITFQTLILCALAPLLLLLSALSGWWVYDNGTRMIEASFNRKLLAMSGSLAALIDAEEHQSYQSQHKAKGLSEEAPFYLRNRQAMSDAMKAAHLTFFYTYLYLGDDKIRYVLDGTEGPTHSPAGSEDKLPNLAAAEGNKQVQYLKRPWVSDIQKWEQWGLLKTSSYPILNKAGDTVAIAGADVDITSIKTKIHWMLFAVLLTGACFLLAAIYVSLKVAHSLIRPLGNLKASALHLAAGNYQALGSAAHSGETATLSNSLSKLGERLAERQSRSRDYQERLHQRQRHTTLARTLEEFSTKFMIMDPGAKPLSRCGSGNCWRGMDGVFWYAPEMENEVQASFLRARLSCLGRQLLAAGPNPADTVAREILASAPELAACARWHTTSRRLYYATRAPAWLWIGSTLKKMDGTGFLELDSDEHFEWSEEGPEGFDVTEAEKGD